MGYQQKLRGLVVSTGLLGAALLGAIAPAWAIDYKQAPMLDEQVKAGKLPAVADRLPENPFVETMVDGVGKYGGTLRTTILANGDQYNLTRTIANELLVRWDPAVEEGHAVARRRIQGVRRCDDLHVQAPQGPEVERRPALHRSTTSCSGTKTCS